MKITLRIEEDGDSTTACSWPEVEKGVRQWATGHASLLPDLPLPQQGHLEIPLDLQADDLLTAVMQLHIDLYELRVNFTVSVD